MRAPRRLLVALLAAAPMGCDWTTEPVALEIQFVGDHTTNADGTCTVQFAVRAAGIGTLAWQRVAIVEDGTVVEELRGAETAEFWGSSQLMAGQQQLSAPFDAPGRALDTRIELTFQVGEADARETELRPDCPGD